MPSWIWNMGKGKIGSEEQKRWNGREMRKLKRGKEVEYGGVNCLDI